MSDTTTYSSALVNYTCTIDELHDLYLEYCVQEFTQPVIIIPYTPLPEANVITYFFLAPKTDYTKVEYAL